jgi:hypothetical protein
VMSPAAVLNLAGRLVRMIWRKTAATV